MNTIDVMKRAKEALEMFVPKFQPLIHSKADYMRDEAISYLEKAIKQEEQAKPVAWRYVVNGVWTNYIEIEPPDDAYDKGSLTPLYATPPSQPVPVKTYSGGKAWPVQPAPLQEPVGVFVEDDDIGHVRLIPHQQLKLKDGDKLYTTPPAANKPWVGLTDEEANAIIKTNWGEMKGGPLVLNQRYIWSIEAKLKEKNSKG